MVIQNQIECEYLFDTVVIMLHFHLDKLLFSHNALRTKESPSMAVEGTDPERRDKLIEMLDIDLQWRMHKVSDGQRRRVQICMGLLHPYKVFRN